MAAKCRHWWTTEDRQPLLKRANVTTEMVGTQSTVGTVCERRATNAVLRASEAVARRVHRGAKPKFARHRHDVMLTNGSAINVLLVLHA